MLTKSLIAASAGLVGSAHAFWRMECPGRVGLARMDPIVDFGETSAHAHSVFGSSGKISAVPNPRCPGTTIELDAVCRTHGG